MNPSEFERTKPVNTHRKIKELEKLIKEAINADKHFILCTKSQFGKG